MFNICYLTSHTHIIWKFHLSPSSSSSPSHVFAILLSSITQLPSILFQWGFVNYLINGSIFHHQQPTPRLVIRFALHTNNKTHFLSFIFTTTYCAFLQRAKQKTWRVCKAKTTCHICDATRIATCAAPPIANL